MKRTARTLLALAVVLAFIATFTGFSYAQARITQQIDDSQAVRLARNTRPEANFKNDRGPVSDGFNAEHMFLLLKRSPEKEKELDQLIDSLNDRKSPNFHKWLTPEEFGERFGVAQDDIDKITGWLEYHGFRVNQVYTNRILIDFSGTAGQLREAFHTEIHQLDVNGQHHVANMGDPQIPAALAPVVKGINSLNDFRPEAMHRAVRRDYTFGGCSTSTQPTFAGTCYSITPQDDAVIYNLNPLWAAGITGAGQTVAVVEDTDTYSGTADWSTYVTTFGLSGYGGTYTQVHPNCADPGTNADDSEAALDVEMASTSAPGAAVWNLACPSGAFTFGGQIALQNLINGAGPYPIVSMSYGEPETVNGNGNNAVFYATFQQAAAQGVSVFVSSGDNGPMSNEYYSNVEVSGTLGVTGWGETPYNVSVGGTDFEEVYNSKTGGAALSTYWNATNTASYGSALSYIPEMPWDNSCANAMIGKIRANTFTPYGTSGSCAGSVSGTDTFTDNGASAGGPSNCATGVNGLNQSNDAATGTDCQGYPKPSWQSAYGVPADSLRDIPDVSLFAANGSWSHSQVICWSDPSYTSDGSATCSGAPSTWSGFGGTSVATPLMAGMQALVNQKTAETWGNPNTVYYQIAQGEYGTQGGSYIGSSCNSSRSGGPASSCVFNDVTQGDIQQACSPAYNPFGATSIRNYCYGYTTNGSAFGATSTDSVSGTNYTIINGGKGYTTTNLPTCTIAGPSNKAAYLSPTGSTLYGGGTQATCTVVSGNVSTSSTTAVWTVRVAQSPDGCGYDSGTGLCDTANAWPVWGNGQVSVVVAGTTYTFFSSLSGVSTPNAVLEYTSSTAENSIGGFAYPTNALNTSKNLYAAITNNSANCASVAPCFANVSAANANATATYSSSGTTNGNITVTSRTAGYSGNFSVSWGPDDAEPEIIQITQTTAGQGPGYISGITIGTAGVGYGLQTPVTISGGPAGAIAPVIVANTSTAVAVSYQPAFGAANGYDLASGLGSVNAYNLACNSAWTGSATNCTTTAVSSSLNPSAYGTGVSFTATVTGNSPTGTVQFVIDGTNFGSPVALSGGSAPRLAPLRWRWERTPSRRCTRATRITWAVRAR